MSTKMKIDEAEFGEAIRELRELHIDPNRSARKAQAFFASELAAKVASSQKRQRRAARWWEFPAWAVLSVAAVFITWRLASQPSPGSAASANEVERPVHVADSEPSASSKQTRIVELGERVATIAAGASEYRVEAVAASETHVRVLRGAVSVRLFHNEGNEHELVVFADDYSFVAKGTIYTVAKSAEGASVVVHEGHVWVHDDEGVTLATLAAGDHWPRGLEENPETALLAEKLAKHSLAVAPPPIIAPPPPREREQERPNPKPAASGVANSTAEESPGAQWQRARLLRAQSNAREAISVLKELGASEDATWAPLAVIEQIRIHHDRSSSPEEIVRLGREFERRFSGHSLSGEVSTMVCPIARRLQARPSLRFCGEVP